MVGAELKAVQIGVNAVLCDQLLVASLLCDLTVGNNGNLIGILDGGKSVRHHKSGSSASFGYNEDAIVSSDVIGITYGSLFDATQTMVTKIDDETYQVQVVSWYDNENSYTSQMVRTIKYFAELA